MIAWPKLWLWVLGWEPSIQHLPAVPAAILIYLSAFAVCYVLYRLTKALVPHPLKEYALDFIKTLVFCTYPFGHGIARKFYGEPGYIMMMVPMNTATAMLMSQGMGNPVAVWLQYVRGGIPVWKSLLKIAMQILGGLAAYRLGMLILMLEFHPLNAERLQEYYSQLCNTDLTVPVYAGFLIEFCGCLYDTWLGLQVLAKHPVLDSVIKFTNGGILVGLGVHLTGMYMHPAMATGHTFGCGHTPKAYHILVYWVAPMIAAYLSTLINRRFSLKRYRNRKQQNQASGSGAQQAVQNGSARGMANGTGARKKSGKRRYYSS